MKTIENYLIEKLNNHIKIETNIFEKYGQLENGYKIAKYIYEKSKEKIKKIDCSKFKTFFDFIEVEYINEIGVCSFDPFNSNYENKILYFSISELKNDNNIENIDLILHEIGHAYEDYNRYKNGVKELKDLLHPNYEKIISGLYNKNEYIKKPSEVLYFLNDQERNAYFERFSTDIDNIIKKLNINKLNIDFDILTKEIKKIPLWKKYFEIGEFIILLKKRKLEKNVIDEFIEWYNLLNNSKYTTKQVIDNIYNKWVKFTDKFSQIVSVKFNIETKTYIDKL